MEQPPFNLANFCGTSEHGYPIDWEDDGGVPANFGGDCHADKMLLFFAQQVTETMNELTQMKTDGSNNDILLEVKTTLFPNVTTFQCFKAFAVPGPPVNKSIQLNLMESATVAIIIKPLIDANLTLNNEIDDIKRLYNEIQCTNNIEKEVTNAKITDNEHLKRNLASIKVKLANIMSPHQKSTNKLHIIQNKYSQITYKKDELRLYLLDIIHDISKIHNKLSFKREELKNLQNEYLIKKRVTLKMNRDINNPTPQYTKQQQLYFEEIDQRKIKIEQQISINKKLEQDLQNLNQQFIDQMKENNNNDVYIDIENVSF